MSRISDIVADRPVFVLLHGKSIKQLEYYMEKLKDKDICYTSVNNFNIMEHYILSKIGKRVSIIHCHSIHGFERRTPAIVEYLQRKDNNLLITTDIAISAFSLGHPSLINEHREKIWLIPSNPWKHFNTVTAFLTVLLDEGVRNIFLFGADGCDDKTAKGAKASYYHPETFKVGRGTGTGVTGDTGRFNRVWPTFETAHNNNGTKILNCSPNSHVNCIPEIRYEQLHDYL